MSKKRSSEDISAEKKPVVIDLTAESPEKEPKKPRVVDVTNDEGTKQSAPTTKEAQFPECGICLDAVAEQGVLDACDHAFCFECIFKWSKTANTCPMCKRSFVTLTPKTLNQAKAPKKRRRAIYHIKEKKQEYQYSAEELAALAAAQEESSDESVGPDEYEADGWLVLENDPWATDSEDFEPMYDPDREFVDQLLLDAMFDGLSENSDSDIDDLRMIAATPVQALVTRPAGRGPAVARGSARASARTSGRRRPRNRLAATGQQQPAPSGLIPADVLSTLRRPRRFPLRR